MRGSWGRRLTLTVAGVVAVAGGGLAAAPTVAAAATSLAPAVRVAAAQSTAAAVTSTPGSYVSLAPARVLDTRTNLGGTGPVAAHGTVHLQVAGRGGVPASGVSAVVVNVTVTAAKSAGFLTVYPDGSTMPTASNLNFAAGQTIPNLVIAKVGANGRIALTNGA
ncbi:hypothetical protein, partial [Pedococcus bigeumensis]|uniref:hypothetical protein n=1 Tax=Pedococcus bigeumensis TaxID=433644 RepID=UPI0019D5E8A1